MRACQAAGVKRIVYLSGAGTRGGRAEPWFRAKWTAEEAIRGSGLEYVILRPSWIYGKHDRSLNKFVAFVRYLPVVPVIGDGKARVQPALVDDIGRVAALAVDESAATNREFELGGPRALSMDAIIRTVQRCSASGSRCCISPSRSSSSAPPSCSSCPTRRSVQPPSTLSSWKNPSIQRPPRPLLAYASVIWKPACAPISALPPPPSLSPPAAPDPRHTPHRRYHSGCRANAQPSPRQS